MISNYFLVEELDTEMPHCQMLHSNLAVAWNLNGGNSLTVELIANIDVTDYVAFGFSKKGASKMVCIINYRFLTTETKLKALYIFRCFFTTSSVKLFVVTVQIFVYKFLFTIVFFGKNKKTRTKTFTF